MPSFYQQAKNLFLHHWPTTQVEYVTAELPGHCFVTSPFSSINVQDWLFSRNRHMEAVDFSERATKWHSYFRAAWVTAIYQRGNNALNVKLWSTANSTTRKIHSSSTYLSLLLATCSGWTARCFHPHVRHEHDHLVSRLNILFPLTSTRVGINLPWRIFSV